MKIGLYFGSFNPIHVGHLIIANHIYQNTDLQQIWLVVTPHNPLKNKKMLLADYHRYEMVHLALRPYENFLPCDIEFHLPKPSYTIYTLLHLQEKYPEHHFHLIMGADNLQNFHKWKNYQAILDYHEIYVYPRVFRYNKSCRIDSKKIHRINAPIVEISATDIRNAIKEGKEVRPLLSDKVWDYIDKVGLYL